MGGRSSAPPWDRFARWPVWPARLALLALAALLIAAALVPIEAGRQKLSTAGFAENLSGKAAVKRPRDDDLMLYDAAIERIGQGENYYDFIVEEHRKADYPVRPGLAVRLPTLAYLDAWLGPWGQLGAALVLMGATLLAWWRRLGEEPGGPERRNVASALLFFGVALGLNRYYFVLHELWAGMLLALAFGLHRPGKRWAGALAAAAAALAIREHALPFVLLMAATAAWRRDWKEAGAWAALVAVFLGGLAWHLSLVEAQTLPGDRLSASWFALRGLSGWLGNIALSSNLRFLPHWLAGPGIVLMVLGWCGWRSNAGTFGALLYLGYGLGFMIAGRPDNFYWGAIVAPALFMGVAFVPMALRSLTRAAYPR